MDWVNGQGQGSLENCSVGGDWAAFARFEWAVLGCVLLRVGTAPRREVVDPHFVATHRVSSVARRLLSHSHELTPPLCVRVSQRSADARPHVDDPPLSSRRAGVSPSRVHGARPPRVAVASPLQTCSWIRDVSRYHVHASVPRDWR